MKYVQIRHFSDPYFPVYGQRRKYVSGGKNLWKIWGTLFSCNTCFEIPPFALLLTMCTINVEIGTNFN